MQEGQKGLAIVTGSTQGIGEEIAKHLLQAGYSVCINDVPANERRISTVVDGLRELYGNERVIGVAADVTNSADVDRMVASAVSSIGPLTAMIANAGISAISPFIEISDDDFLKLFNVNVFGVFACYRAAARQMIRQGPAPKGSVGYRIIGACSCVAFRTTPLHAHYTASKMAVRGLTSTLAVELASYDIKVNSYAPGIVTTPMWDALDAKLAKIHDRKPGESFQQIAAGAALGRASTPEDVAKVAVGFLCSPNSDFVTGQTIVVDGGIVFN